MSEDTPYTPEPYQLDPMVAKAQAAGEIFMPFQFAADGSVRVTPSPLIAMGQHIESMICTRIGERVMRPSYGSSAYDSVLDVADETKADRLQSEISDLIRREEPSVGNLLVTVTPNRNSFSIMVTFTLPPFPGSHTVTPPVLPTFSEES